MAYTPPTDDILRKLMTDSRTIAIVGASGNPDRAAYGIMQKLQSVGYQVIPVTPREADILGEPSYPSLREITVPVDIGGCISPARRHASYCRRGRRHRRQGAVAAI